MFGYWKNQHIHRGFIPGGMFIKDDFVYIPIPKNSSSYVGQLLLKNDWGIGNFLTTDLSNKKIIVLLRDPVDRWVSGMTQYLCSVLLKNGRTSVDIINNWNQIVQEIVFDQIIFDDHTERQTYFINGIPQENCVFFNSVDKPEQHIKNYLNLDGYDLNTNIEIDQNQSQGNEYKETLIKFLKTQLITNPELEHKLINTYQEDFKLWKLIT